jgi:hypothetical protein
MTASPTLRGTCRSCGAPLIWVHTAATGRSMPLNAEPDPKRQRPHRRRARPRLAQAELDEPAGERFMPHHATCPDAGHWRTAP